ncbi:TPA: TIGR00269 family protein [Candidatus Geothermarchaeota archaeon]|nr:TIGR00269 family protein [Candidatus Geothermarchaeota archaeon]HIQ13838.1 TIGR00269 family protein [Thermoprotei archaeon]
MPIKCSRCGSADGEIYIDYIRQYLCIECFNKFFEGRVKKTIDKYRMLSRGDYVAVGLSGGKDSAALLTVLKKLYPDKKYIAIHLHHGIYEYSEDSYVKARELAESLDVEFHVFRYEDELGVTIPDIKATRYGRKICSTCGFIRRWALAKASRMLGVDILATGHNLDDTLEVMLSSFISGDYESIYRLRPVLPPLPPNNYWKVKPLINTPEYEVLLYVSFNRIPIKSLNCPFGDDARSIRRKEILRIWSEREPMVKFQLFSSFTKKFIPLLDKVYNEDHGEVRICRLCGGPSLSDICSTCRKIQYVKKVGVRG